MGILTAWVERSYIGAGGRGLRRMASSGRCVLAGRIVWFYLGKLLWPAPPLLFIYPRWDGRRGASGYLWLFLGGCSRSWGPLCLYPAAGRGPPWLAPCSSSARCFPRWVSSTSTPSSSSYVADHFQYSRLLRPLRLGGRRQPGAGCSDRIRGRRRAAAASQALAAAVLAVVLTALGWCAWRESGHYRHAGVLLSKSNILCSGGTLPAGWRETIWARTSRPTPGGCPRPSAQYEE